MSKATELADALSRIAKYLKQKGSPVRAEQATEAAALLRSMEAELDTARASLQEWRAVGYSRTKAYPSIWDNSTPTARLLEREKQRNEMARWTRQNETISAQAARIWELEDRISKSLQLTKALVSAQDAKEARDEE